jgi:hypothetical protein
MKRLIRRTRTARAGSKAGHAFGIDLSAAQKDALIEYLKTL